MKSELRRIWRTAALAALLSAGVAAPTASLAVAQAATPAAGSIAPKPDECTVRPRALPLLPPGTPGAPAATPGPLLSPTPFAMPTGQPADAATTKAVTATIHEAVACRNADDFRRAYALFTDAMLGRMFGSDETIDPEIAAAIAEGPQRLPRGERLSIVSIGEVLIDADGRASTVVETKSPDGEFRDLLFFAKAPQGWLIDDAEPLRSNAVATPAGS